MNSVEFSIETSISGKTLCLKLEMQLGYWGIRGRAHKIRLLLGYLNVQWEDKLYSSPDQWAANKENLGLDFPNLPYLIDGEVKITESSAIPYYIAQKMNREDLFGKDLKSQAQHSQILATCDEISNAISQVNMAPNPPEAFRFFLMNVFGPKVETFVRFLANKQFLLGDFSYADIVVTYTLEVLENLGRKLNAPSIYTEFPNLKGLRERVYSQPGIRKFLETHPTAKLPMLPPHLNPLRLE